jgi:hypothetical protein
MPAAGAVVGLMLPGDDGIAPALAVPLCHWVPLVDGAGVPAGGADAPPKPNSLSGTGPIALAGAVSTNEC